MPLNNNEYTNLIQINQQYYAISIAMAVYMLCPLLPLLFIMTLITAVTTEIHTPYEVTVTAKTLAGFGEPSSLILFTAEGGEYCGLSLGH